MLGVSSQRQKRQRRQPRLDASPDAQRHFADTTKCRRVQVRFSADAIQPVIMTN